MTAKTLMIQGTMSSAGKSLLVTGLCRLYTRRGLRVVPFKSQNMSNNAGVTLDGAEIGRAQYTQALACGVAPTVDMNPILVKPEAGGHSQVVLMGKPYVSLEAGSYYQHLDHLWSQATAALDRLRASNDLVIIEGAGSPAEVNLRKGDIVNMAVAKYTRSPVLLAGDVDRGGIFAQLLGTLWLLEPEERALVKGLIVNKFRGQIDLFYDGVQILEEKGGVPVVGVVPFIHHHIPEEDAVAIEGQNTPRSTADEIDIAVVRLPLISNFDDFDPLKAEPGVSVRYIDSLQQIGDASAVILPGSKSTISDLNWLVSLGLFDALIEYALNGGAVVGICGGYQMLGRLIHDPEQVESQREVMVGLSLLPTETFFQPVKATHQAQAAVQGGEGWLAKLHGERLHGYEIHMGETKLIEGAPWLEIEQRSGEAVSVADGAFNYHGRVWGCYLHGIFQNERFRRAWLRSLGWQGEDSGQLFSLEESFDRLADHLEASLQLDMLDEIIGF
ncbi:MAG: cobyric acid synthase [Anaerolineales bacterium]